MLYVSLHPFRLSTAGQILGGNSPQDAARYQLVVLMMIASSSFFCVACSVILVVLCVVDADGSVRVERIRRSAEEPSVFEGVGTRIALVSREVASLCYRCWCCAMDDDEEGNEDAEEEEDSTRQPLL